jgi:hypothetical protein
VRVVRRQSQQTVRASDVATIAPSGSPRSSEESRRKDRRQEPRIHQPGSGTEKRDNPGGWPQDKSLTLVPELFRISLAYGVNPLTGRTTEPWRIRNVVRWVRPNPPVGALGDKFRPATSEMVQATKSRTRYFDLDAVRESWARDYADERPTLGNRERDRQGRGRQNGDREVVANPAGAPPLDWWAIPTEPYPGSHYATWPRDLLVKPIKAMCPSRVCRVCGEPSRRIVEQTEEYANRTNGGRNMLQRSDPAQGFGGKASRQQAGQGHTKYRPPDDPSRTGAQYRTTGWTDCGHDDDYRPGVVLDPFAGSGTTGAVATGHGRDAVLIDIDERNADLARERIGLFLTVEHFTTEGAA